ncbi:heterokaryon incompatibility protein-domain-containing protein [Chaetomidium leptoderma]|uniref:Heterokaryon incompatibility protein-domain-containing protein n=1 Tax=Chaetomidium leptoderma TaxID=669021 RepID=A0AAN6VH41_9PEZI|nr:heterokaryon incompatibility protein-domain-containing protein [Chaetomidium leptoderma]
MRLLYTTNLQLVDFQGQRILPPTILPPTNPPYAILSHTWTEEEVSFQDVQQGLVQSRWGYKKVASACALVVQDGFKYLWIDTCCIDKSSLVELSEAINSMFQWYCDVEACYVFLSDVDADKNPYSKAKLIAPGVVYFYGMFLDLIMSWAAFRETTRPEDEAYSLLGLFDINMPLLYGEGEHAF